MMASVSYRFSLYERVDWEYGIEMGRQIFFFILVCAAWAPVMGYAQADFWRMWVEMSAAGQVSNEDYYETWRRYLLPYAALFALTIVPVIICSSLGSIRQSFQRPARKPRLWRQIWLSY